MRDGLFPAISVNKDVLVISDCSHNQWWADEPQGSSRRKGKNTCCLAAARLQPLPRWAPRKLRVWTHRILAPDSWDVYQRNDFSESRLLHLPICRKAPSSLTWDTWFSLINNLNVPTTCPLLSNSYTSQFLPYSPWSNFSELSETLPPRLQSSFFPK